MVWRNYIIDVKEVNAVGGEPIDVAFVKDYLKVSYDDAVIQLLIPAARRLLEKNLNISFIQKTLLITIQHGGLFPIALPYGPHSNITSVAYKDCDCNGVAFTNVGNEGYCLIGEEFKQFQTDAPGYYKITCEAGYTQLPGNLLESMLQQLAWMYENRGDEKQAKLNPNLQMLTSSLTRNSWI